MANSTAVQPIPLNITSITGPLIFGTLINWTLYGVLSLQIYVYYQNFPDDSLRNKLLVYGCYVIEMAQTAMNGADFFFWFGSGFGNVAGLGEVHISPLDVPIFCGIIAAIVQLFFAYRIFTLRRSYLWICILIILTSTLQITAAIATGYRSFKLHSFTHFHENNLFPQAFDVWSVGNTACDTLISGTMLWLLYKSEDNGCGHSKKIIGKLVRLVVETNTLTASVALLSFVFYVSVPHLNLYVFTTLIMGKLYSNTLLVTFNNRIALRNMSEVIHFDAEGSRQPCRRQGPSGIEVTTFQATPEARSCSGHSEDLEFQRVNMSLPEPKSPGVIDIF
ncbi:hypothetical protein HYPSUDRAFT_39550 [Hypholoma sublateritium FD-334 SS-4]|uniref:DUF6534 domain-containing protein n=1 Tax=Hypholoma sublateritium (strain FD-334 SS-4) TaxID=945553 RepID=A0A0D2NYD3_HYPSF|nr:hypothetical protein HYPSUDRAFT_39550 [Hypholoma sublateritium FD-334 SS-4]